MDDCKRALHQGFEQLEQLEQLEQMEAEQDALPVESTEAGSPADLISSDSAQPGGHVQVFQPAVDTTA